MTEAEWLACEEPTKMVRFLGDEASDRKLRLLGCGCCRQVWHLLVDDGSRRAVDGAERFADGLITRKTLRKHWVQANGALQRVESDDVTPLRKVIATALAMCTCDPFRGKAGVAWDNGQFQKLQEAQETQLLRCIFGDPFRPVTFAPAWRTAALTSLAQAIYDERAFDRLPILADALEDAGSANSDILSHCRDGHDHVRGCWVVDLVLGKR